ncbi:MAG: sigma-70 family RNA polymerase sigma factor [Saprospiraceae bacterium]|nr:sigma-70 family RNA polymerase sigma factor [Saprospiraceae bacterium]
MTETASDNLSRKSGITAVVQEYGKKLFRFIRGRVTNDADAEDILQDVWYQFSRVVDVEPIEQISGWLFRVARNRLTDRFRQQKPRSLEDFVYEDEEGAVSFKDLLLVETDNPESEFLKQAIWDEFMAALEELPEAQRNVFVWNELEDETFQSISDRTGENIKTLISRKRYAVQYLRTRLETIYQEF